MLALVSSRNLYRLWHFPSRINRPKLRAIAVLMITNKWLYNNTKSILKKCLMPLWKDLSKCPYIKLSNYGKAISSVLRKKSKPVSLTLLCMMTMHKIMNKLANTKIKLAKLNGLMASLKIAKNSTSKHLRKLSSCTHQHLVCSLMISFTHKSGFNMLKKYVDVVKYTSICCLMTSVAVLNLLIHVLRNTSSMLK